MAGWLGGVRRQLARLVGGGRTEQAPATVPAPRPREPAWPEEVTHGWLAATDPEEMLDKLGDDASPRKLRLFALACCRPLGTALGLPWLEQALEVCERRVDGAISANEIQALRDLARKLRQDLEAAGEAQVLAHWTEEDYAAEALVQLIEDEENGTEVSRSVAQEAAALLTQRGLTKPAHRHVRARQAVLLREIFGNPFRPVNIDPLWLSANDGAVLDLARMMDEGGTFDVMPILADALEEAGCADTDILWHCRHGKNHVRGCWVVDALVGKS
jgi:hypothetical protein